MTAHSSLDEHRCWACGRVIAAVEEGEDWHAVVALLHEEAKAEVKRQAAASRPKGRGPGDGWGE